ncbi:MAG: PD40 domain-containing protein [Taibaiella sp.]|nr:PD40 domain-containing protein [Taibaiella sp.]
MRKGCLLFIVCMLLSALCYPQGGRRLSRRYNKALMSWAKQRRSDAYARMSKVINKSPSSPEGYSKLGEWYFTQHLFTEAINVFREASVKCPDGRKRFALALARSYASAGSADSALLLAEQYSRSAKNKDQWNKIKTQAVFAKEALMHPGKWPESLGPRINSRYPEVFPSMTVDTSVIYFTRRVRNMDEDFYEAKLDTQCEGWFSADNLGAPPNTISHESAQFISADGHYLFFSRSDNRSINGWADGGYDLYMAYRVATDSEWTIPVPFGSGINTPDFEGMPSLTPDNRQLYFVSDRPGGFGGLDIWVSTFENNLWQMPYNAGPRINTAGDETAPFISMDNKTLFFSSDGHPGMGGSDIYRAVKLNDSEWRPAINLGYPINTACNEESEWMVMNGEKMYFASDRAGPAGNFDLYETRLPVSFQPSPVAILQGYIYDSIGRTRLNSSAIYIINAVKGDTIYQLYSNRGDASYVLPLAANVTYAMHSARIGYTDVNDTFLIDKSYIQRTYNHNVAMLPYDYIKPIHDTLIATIHFNINKVELSDSDKAVLTRAMEPYLLDSRGVMLYVNGFTDNTGNPMLNEELSTRRAYLVAKTLTDLGIEELAIIAKGWGEAKMISTNETEEGQRLNRRVEVILRRN